MATKKGKKKPPVEEPEATEEVTTVEVEPVTGASETVGPSETTVDKGPDETPEVWQCPYCDTRYRADMEVARDNHLKRVHGE